MFVQRVKLGPGTAEREHTGPADKRDVVKMNDVEVPGEDRFELAALQPRSSCLLGYQWRKRAPGGAKTMHDDAVVFRGQ